MPSVSETVCELCAAYLLHLRHPLPHRPDHPCRHSHRCRNNSLHSHCRILRRRHSQMHQLAIRFLTVHRRTFPVNQDQRVLMAESA